MDHIELYSCLTSLSIRGATVLAVAATLGCDCGAGYSSTYGD